MTLDEIEQMATILATEFDDWNASHADAAVDLTRALLAVLPVIRAAEGWWERGPGQNHCDDEGCRCHEQLLREALIEMRKRLGGG